MSLYPPIIASSMPAFNAKADSVRVYYTLPNYNSSQFDDIKSVHYTVRRQSSNVNVLNGEIGKATAFQADQQGYDKALNRYYIDINAGDIKGGFQPEALYKVQLRFSTLSPDSTQTVSFYTNNINKYSQWSTVCVLKPIILPEFYINDFYVEGASKDTENFFYYSLADFVCIFKQGKVVEDGQEKYSSQSLKEWRLRLLKGSYNDKTDRLNIDNYTLADSGWTSSSANNYTLDSKSLVLTCSLPYELKTTDLNNDSSNIYYLLYEIKTRNDYQGRDLEKFTFSAQSLDSLSGTLKLYTNEEEGYIKVSFESSGEDYIGNLVLRRSDEKSKFLKWQDVKFFENYGEEISFTYYDFTIQSGIFYRYLIQKVDARGRRGTPLYDNAAQNENATLVEFEHPYLLQITGNGNVLKAKQLKLKYDFEISSYQTNISENLTNTIGSKYPFIRRNGNMYYRSFPCSGTITECMDQSSLFATEDTLLNGYTSLYDKYKKDSPYEISKQYDYTYERRFREEVEKFLYNSKPKLYRSLQEGNIFIKLMQVSLSPKNELGRLVYTFSGTAYEIDAPTLTTYNNYGLIDIGQYNPSVTQSRTKIAQISSYSMEPGIEPIPFKAEQNIMGLDKETAAAAENSIAKSVKYNTSFNGTIVKSFNIDWLRLTIDSQPYLIKKIGDRYYPLEEKIQNQTTDFGDIANPLYQIQSTYTSEGPIYLGHLFRIHGKDIIVSYPNNVYEIKQTGFNFNQNVSIIPAKDTIMTVDFRINYPIEEDISLLPKKKEYVNTNGQLVGTFDSSQDLIVQIKYKYFYSYDEQSQKINKYVQGVKTVLVDTQPGAVIMMKTSTMPSTQGYNRFVVDETGVLNFDPGSDTVSITNFKVCGMNFSKEELNYKGTTEPQNPKIKDLYKSGNKYYCYYQRAWRQATPVYPIYVDSSNYSYSTAVSFDIDCPVDALVFYCAAVGRDYY